MSVPTLPQTKYSAQFVLNDCYDESTHSLKMTGGTPGGSNSQIQYNNAGAFGGISTFNYDGTNVILSDNIFLKVGTTNPFSLGNVTGGGADLGVLSTNAGSNVLLFSTEANKNYNFVNVAVASSTPLLAFTTDAQVRNKFTFISMSTNADANPALIFDCIGGDDIDGTQRNSKGVGFVFTSSSGGTLGGNGGDLIFTSGSGTFAGTTGGDAVFNFGNGAGGGRAGVMRAGSTNSDFGIAPNGTGKFKVLSTDYTNYVSITHDSSNGNYAVSTGNHNFVGNVSVSQRILGASTSATAANNLTLGNANQFLVSGNTQINAITTTGWTAGSQITLVFSGTPTVKHNTAGGAGTAKIFLATSSDLLCANNTVLGLEYDGTQWQQTFLKQA